MSNDKVLSKKMANTTTIMFPNCEVIMDSDKNPAEEIKLKGIKRTKDLKKIERRIQKYSDKDPALKNFIRPCNHDGKSFACSSITMDDIREMRREFFSDTNKFRQDLQLCTYISVVPAKRRRSKNEIKTRNATLNYLLTKSDGESVRVCNTFFISVFEVSKHRILTVAKGADSRERRGGDRRSQKSILRREKAKIFVSKIKEREGVPIKEFHKLYLKSCDIEDHVSYSLFRRIFLSD